MDTNEQPDVPMQGDNVLQLHGRPRMHSLSREQYEQEVYEPTLWEGTKAAFGLENTVSSTLQLLENSGHRLDVNFMATEDHMKEWTKDLPEQYHDAFLDAQSEEHGWAIRRQMDKEMEADATLGRMGWGGLGLRLVAGVMDPIAWGAVIATEGAAAPWLFANKASRLSRAVRGAVVGAGTNVGIESYLYSQSQTKDAHDILWAAVLGAGMGAAVTPFMRGHPELDEVGGATAAATRILRQEDNRRLADALEEAEQAAPKAEAPARGPEEPVEATSGSPRDTDSSTSETPVESSPSVVALDEFRAARRDARQAYDEMESSATQASRLYDELADMNDDIRLKEAAIQWLHAIERAIPRVDGEALPAVSKADLKELPGILDNMVDEDDLEKLQEMILGLSKDKDVSAVRKELRTLTKKLVQERQRKLQEAERLSANEVYLRDRYAKLKAREDELNERLDGTARSVGAAQVRQHGVDYPLLDESELDAKLDDMDIPVRMQGVLGRARYDIIGRLLRSHSPYVRAMAGKLAEDAVGRADHAVAGKTASEVATHIRELAQYNVYKVAEPAFRQWVRDRGGNWLDMFKPQNRREFYEEVSAYIRDVDREFPSSVRATGNAMRKEYANFLQKAKAARLKGFEHIPEDPTYLPRFADKVAVRQLNAEFADSEIVKLIQGAILKAVPDIDAMKLEIKGVPYSERLAKGYWKKMRSLERGLDTDFAHPIGVDNNALIRQVLKEDDVDEATIQNIEEALSRANRTKDGGKLSRAKARLDLDETHSAKLKMRDGTEREVLLSELFENDAEKLFSVYSRQLSGHIALGQQGWRSKADFQRWLQLAQNNSAELSDAKTAAKEAELLQFLYDGITGVPLERDPASWLSTAGRVARDWNFVRIMNQVGFAQVAEIGNMVGAVGWRAVLTHVPELRATMRRLKSGELEDSYASQLEAIWSIGTQRLRNQVSTRYDEYGYGVGGRALQGYDNAMQYAKRITADISLMAPVNMMLHRTAVKAVIQNLTDSAQELAKLSPKRLASIGISQEMLPRIQKLLLDHTTRKDSLFGKGRKVNGLDMASMMKADPEAADILVHGVNRWVKRIIQENDIGSTHEWMHSSLGKMLFQFRSFMLVAWGKQTLHNIHMADMQSFAMFSYSMMFGGLAYSAQTAINSVGRADQSEFLEERLNPTALALAAFQRAGASSLVPAAVDTAWTTFGGQSPLFAYGRSTGLAADMLMGNPTVDLAQKITGTMGITKNLRGDHELSQKNVRDVWGLLWFNNAMGVRNISNLLLNDLPTRSSSYQ